MKHFFPLTLAALALVFTPRADAGGKDPQDVPFQTATGIIAEVRPLKNQVVLKLRKGEVIELTADARSRIEFPQAEGKLAMLKEGKRVRVTFYVKDGANRLLSLTEPAFTLGKIKQGINLALMFAKTASFKERDEFKKNLQIIIQDVDEQIAGLEEKDKKADAPTRKLIAQDVEALRLQREALRDQLARVNAATADNWTEVRDGVNNLIVDLQRLLDRARAKSVEKDRP